MRVSFGSNARAPMCDRSVGPQEAQMCTVQKSASANAAHLRRAQSPGVAQSLRALFAEIGVDYGPYRIKKKK